MIMGYITKYAAAGLATAMLLMFIYFKTTINGLEATNLQLRSDISSLQVDVVTADRNTAVCKLALESQTKDIEILRVDYNQSVAALNKWKSQPADIRYNTIYKTITKVDYREGECNATKKLISDISNINYADL